MTASAASAAHFLIGARSASPGIKAKKGADEKKDHAGHYRHVIARDRQHVADPGNKQRVVNVWRDGVAPAVNQHRGDRAIIAGEHGANAGIDSVA